MLSESRERSQNHVPDEARRFFPVQERQTFVLDWLFYVQADAKILRTEGQQLFAGT